MSIHPTHPPTYLVGNGPADADVATNAGELQAVKGKEEAPLGVLLQGVVAHGAAQSPQLGPRLLLLLFLLDHHVHGLGRVALFLFLFGLGRDDAIGRDAALLGGRGVGFGLRGRRLGVGVLLLDGGRLGLDGDLAGPEGGGEGSHKGTRGQGRRGTGRAWRRGRVHRRRRRGSATRGELREGRDVFVGQARSVPPPALGFGLAGHLGGLWVGVAWYGVGFVSRWWWAACGGWVSPASPFFQSQSSLLGAPPSERE